MIDIENKVFNDVCTKLRTELLTEYPTLTVYGEYVDVPSSFPCVTLVEDDNSVYTASQDNVGGEHHARVMYSANVYTNNQNGKKGIAKEIADIIDTEMRKMNFTRSMRNQIPNEDRTIYRITMRYTAIVGEPTEDDDGNLTYHIYRR